MFTIERILHDLKSHVVYSQICVSPAHEFKGVMIYERGMQTVPDIVYSAKAEDLIADFDALKGKCFAVCTSSDDINYVSIPKNVTVLVLNCSITAASNELIRIWQNCLKRKALYKELAVSGGQTLQNYVNLLGTEIETTVLILSSGFSLLAGYFCNTDEDLLLRSLRETGALDADEARSFVNELCYLSDSGRYSEYVFHRNGSRSLVRHLQVHNYTVAHIVVILQNNEDVNYYLGEVEELSSYVIDVLNSNSGSFTLNGPFNDLVIDVLEHRLTGRDTINARLAGLPSTAYGSAFYLVTVEFVNKPQDFRWHFISNQIHDIFPASNISVYNDTLLVLSKYDADSGVNFDRELLNSILLEHNAYAAVGASTRYLSALPTMYQQCQLTIRIAKKLNNTPNQRIFNYEDYSVYMIIEMCISDHFKSFHQGRYYFLCHQDVLRLARYDRKNNTDYLHVLYVYLANNCKITQASRALYMHRNTMISKVEKIEQIIGEPLDNSFLQERLIFSYHLIEYIEKYLGEDIFPQSLMD